MEAIEKRSSMRKEEAAMHEPRLVKGGPVMARGRIRRIWRPRYIELYDNGVVKYYEDGEQFESAKENEGLVSEAVASCSKMSVMNALSGFAEGKPKAQAHTQTQEGWCSIADSDKPTNVNAAPATTADKQATSQQQQQEEEEEESLSDEDDVIDHNRPLRFLLSVQRARLLDPHNRDANAGKLPPLHPQGFVLHALVDYHFGSHFDQGFVCGIPNIQHDETLALNSPTSPLSPSSSSHATSRPFVCAVTSPSQAIDWVHAFQSVVLNTTNDKTLNHNTITPPSTPNSTRHLPTPPFASHANTSLLSPSTASTDSVPLNSPFTPHNINQTTTLQKPNSQHPNQPQQQHNLPPNVTNQQQNLGHPQSTPTPTHQTIQPPSQQTNASTTQHAQPYCCFLSAQCAKFTQTCHTSANRMLRYISFMHQQHQTKHKHNGPLSRIYSLISSKRYSSYVPLFFVVVAPMALPRMGGYMPTVSIRLDVFLVFLTGSFGVGHFTGVTSVFRHDVASRQDIAQTQGNRSMPSFNTANGDQPEIDASTSRSTQASHYTTSSSGLLAQQSSSRSSEEGPLDDIGNDDSSTTSSENTHSSHSETDSHTSTKSNNNHHQSPPHNYVHLSPLPQYPSNKDEQEKAKQSNASSKVPPLTSCWSEPPANIFKVRGTTYLQDRVKIPSAESTFVCRGVDLWLTETAPLRNIARHPAMLGGKLHSMSADHNKEGMFVVNFLLPFGNFVAYFAVPPDTELPPNVAQVWKNFIQGDDQYRNARLKLLPVVMEGPWIVRTVVGPGNSPALLGKVVPLEYYFHIPTNHNTTHHNNDENNDEDDELHTDSHHSGGGAPAGPIYEVDIIIAASSIANGILNVVKGHSKNVTMAFAFIIEAAVEEELPETVLACFTIHSLHIDHCPKLPPPFDFDED